MTVDGHLQLNMVADVRDELMTAAELADLLKMRRSTIEDYARRGLLPSFKLGRHRRFIRSDGIEALDELRRRAA